MEDCVWHDLFISRNGGFLGQSLARKWRKWGSKFQVQANISCGWIFLDNFIWKQHGGNSWKFPFLLGKTQMVSPTVKVVGKCDSSQWTAIKSQPQPSQNPHWNNVRNHLLPGSSTGVGMSWAVREEHQFFYPLVNIQKTMERSTMLSMGKSTISTGAILNSYVCLPEGNLSDIMIWSDPADPARPRRSVEVIVRKAPLWRHWIPMPVKLRSRLPERPERQRSWRIFAHAQRKGPPWWWI